MSAAANGLSKANIPGRTRDEHPADRKRAPDTTLENTRPRLNVGQIYETRRLLRLALEDRWLDQVPPPAVIKEQMLPAVRACLSLTIKPSNIHTTLIWHLNGIKVTKESWDHLATRLAGNIGDIRIEPLTSSMTLEGGGWALVETVEAELYKSKAGNAGAMFQYRVLSGKAAAYYFKQFMPLGFMPTYGKNLGVGKARWWKQPRLYVAMKLLAYLLPARQPRQLRFDRHHAPPSCRDTNRYYASGRSQECINKLHHQCWNCPRGLLEDDEKQQCEYATHRYAWVKRTCARCGRIRWFYSHWDRKSNCLSCREAPIWKG